MNTPNVKCTKCELEGITECPYCKDVYPVHHHFYNLVGILQDDDSVKIVYPYSGNSIENDIDNIIENIRIILNLHNENKLLLNNKKYTWNQHICDHKWIFIDEMWHNNCECNCKLIV